MALNIPNIAPPGPGGRLFESYNAISNANLENRKKEIENQFAPDVYKAEIARLTSPMSLYGEKAGSLSYLDARKNGQSTAPNVATPPPQQYGGLINALLGGSPTAGGNQPGAGGNPMNNPMPAPQSQTTPSNTSSYDAKGDNIKGDPQAILDRNDQATSGNNNKNNPYDANTDDQGRVKGYKPGSLEQSIAEPGNADIYNANEKEKNLLENKQMNALQDQAQKFSEVAPKIEANVKSLTEAYKHIKSWSKGPVGSRTPTFMNDKWRDKAITAQNNLIALNAPLQNGGHLTNQGYTMSSDIKPNIALTDGGFKNAVEYSNGLVQRGKELLPIFNVSKKGGLKSGQISQLISNYNEYHPFYDAKNSKAANKGKYKDYITPESLKHFANGEEYNPGGKQQTGKQWTWNPKTQALEEK